MLTTRALQQERMKLKNGKGLAFKRWRAKTKEKEEAVTAFRLLAHYPIQ